MYLGARRPAGSEGSEFPASGPDHTWLNGEPVDWAYLDTKGWSIGPSGQEPNNPQEESVFSFVINSDTEFFFNDLENYDLHQFSCEFDI